jgi:hypothetical protein
MSDHSSSAAPTPAPGARPKRFRPLVIAAIAVGALAVGLGIKFGVSAYTASVEQGLEPPKEFKRPRPQQPPPEEPPAPEGEAPAGTGAPEPASPGAPPPSGPAPTGSTGPTG